MAVYSSPPPQLPPLRSIPLYSSKLPLTVDNTHINAVAALSTRSQPLQGTQHPWVTKQPPPVSVVSNPHAITTRRPTQHTFSSFMAHNSSSTILAALQTPSILAAFVAYLDWSDFYPFLSTSKTVRDLFKVPHLRDVILCRYVPGYAHCLRLRDFRFYQPVHVSLHDLDLLLISQRVPLHRYPMHSLRTMTALYPTIEDDEMTSKLVALAQAHSRFVLLLQSIVHSSKDPLPLEPEDLSSSTPYSRSPSLRELTFPAPLAYTQPPPPAPEQQQQKKKKHHHSRSVPTAIPPYHNAAKPGHHAPHHSANSLPPTNTIRSRRFSILRKPSKIKSPPPPEEPRSLKHYSSTWRKSLYFHQQHQSADEDGFSETLKRPRRRFVSANNSSASSLSRSSVIGGTPYTPLRMMSPHDLSLATSRMRAPILRVFVPCSRMEDADEGILGCEKQLQDSGLWNHLSIGDVVCNLGYVPANGTGDEGGSSDGDEIGMEPAVVRSRSDRSQPSSASSTSYRSLVPPSPTSPSSSNPNARKWLIFNGEFLVPYTPPNILPLNNPLALPCPFYYAHIMPSGSPNVTYVISRFPVCDDVPQLTLVHSTSKVPSPHSPSGSALVKKFAWTARVFRGRETSDVGYGEDVGDGWYGEWVLEGEGTMEGKQTLLDAIAGRDVGLRRWEVVREKSGQGRIWLKLLP